ncbi:DUF6056 family protein [Streptomyces sp. NPDC058953]|uniref:DUF6056 family protein n=1 Tax=unclassified Streptomyces TaxID=2593676 RepID=UPI0036C30FEB
MVVDSSGTAGHRRTDRAGKPPRQRLARSGRPWTDHWALICSSVPLGLLAAAMWFGRWVRPGGDDWCFLPVVRDGGLTGMLEQFYVQDNGRVANALLVWSYATFGVPGHQWFGLVSGLVILTACWAVTAAAVRAAGVTVPRGVPLLVASMVTVLFLFASPNTYKTFYWPAASVSHTLAPVLAAAAVIPLLRARSRAAKTAALVTAFLTGVFIGTLSEETSVVVLVVLAAVLLLGRRIVTGSRWGHVRLWCLLGIAGTVIGTLVLVTSPGSRNRRESRDTGLASMFAPDSLIGAAKGFTRILGTLLTTWPYAGAVAAGILLGALATRAGATTAGGTGAGGTTAGGTGAGGRTAPLTGHLSLLGAGVLTFLTAGYLCVLAAYPVFGPGVVLSTRLWNDFLFLYIVLLLGAGVLVGHRLRRRTRRTAPTLVAGTAVCGLVCLALALPLGRLEDTMQVRAGNWDRQDRWLRTEAQNGARVLPYRPMYISKMTEPFGGGGRRPWPSVCVADYYRVDRVTQAHKYPWQ